MVLGVQDDTTSNFSIAVHCSPSALRQISQAVKTPMLYKFVQPRLFARDFPTASLSASIAGGCFCSPYSCTAVCSAQCTRTHRAACTDALSSSLACLCSMAAVMTVLQDAWSKSRALTVTAVAVASSVALGLLWRTLIMDRHTVSLITRLAPDYDQRMARHKRRLFAGLQQIKAARADGCLVILEIGSGSGANFQYYPDGAQMICIERNRLFETPLRASVQLRPEIEISQFHVASAENMRDVTSNSVDAVVSTKVLCSVADVDKCLQEILRVLKPVSQFSSITADQQHTTYYVIVDSLMPFQNAFCQPVVATMHVLAQTI